MKNEFIEILLEMDEDGFFNWALKYTEPDAKFYQIFSALLKEHRLIILN